MPVVKLTEEMVVNAAEEIVKEGIYPNLTMVRKKVEVGSQSTLYKYLSKWKLDMIKKGMQVKEGMPLDANVLEVIKKQNEQLSYDLNELEQAQMENQDEITSLKAENEKLQRAFDSETNKAESLEDKMNAVLAERKNAIDTIIQNKDETIKQLMDEIKHLNLTHLEAIRELSTKDHDKLMFEKVKSTTLKDKLEEYEGKAQDLEEKLKRAKAVTAPLKKELDFLTNLLLDKLGPDALAGNIEGKHA